MFLLLALANLAATPTIAEAPLKPLSSFVGHCWRGDAPGGAGTDTHCFDTLYNGRHVRDRHEVTVDGKTVYAGETLYSAEGGGISFTYWNSLGGVGHGKAQATGAEIDFSGEMREDPTTAPTPMHATWRILKSGYEVIWPDGTPHLLRRVD
jgi:hypothetical protein